MGKKKRLGLADPENDSPGQLLLPFTGYFPPGVQQVHSEFGDEPDWLASNGSRNLEIVECKDRFVYGNGLKGEVNGKYYVFGSVGIIVARLWPIPMAWHKGPPSGNWRGLRPHLDLRAQLISLPMREPGASFRKWALRYQSRPPYVEKFNETPGMDPALAVRRRNGYEAAVRALERSRVAFSWVPKPVSALIGKFPNRQWQLLSLAARCPAVLELIESSPALAFALASGVFRPKRPRVKDIKRMIDKPRRKILEWLGFLASESVVKIFAKIPTWNCGVVPLFCLRNILNNAGGIERLRHLPHLPAMAILLLANQMYAPVATDSFLAEVAHEAMQDDAISTARFLADCSHISRETGILLPRRLASMEQLRHWHDRQVEEMNRRKFDKMMALQFPEPPLPGEGGIEPILSPAELLAEGRSQHNCVLSYASRVASGQVYIYRVTSPERATLSIEPRGNGRWEVDQLAAAFNEPVAQETQRAVKHWLLHSVG